MKWIVEEVKRQNTNRSKKFWREVQGIKLTSRSNNKEAQSSKWNNNGNILSNKIKWKRAKKKLERFKRTQSAQGKYAVADLRQTKKAKKR